MSTSPNWPCDCGTNQQWLSCSDCHGHGTIPVTDGEGLVFAMRGCESCRQAGEVHGRGGRFVCPKCEPESIPEPVDTDHEYLAELFAPNMQHVGKNEPPKPKRGKYKPVPLKPGDVEF